MGAALLAFLDAQLQPGIKIVTEATGLEASLDGTDLVITGEGRIDRQTVCGKTPVGIAKLAKQKGIPVIAIAGCLGEGHEKVYAEGIDAVFPVIPALSDHTTILENASENIRRTAANVMRVMMLGNNLNQKNQSAE